MTEKANKKYSIGLYLGLIVLLWLFCLVTLKIWLLPYSIAYAQTGNLSFGYIAYALIGLLFSTPAPFLSVLLIALCKEKISFKVFLKRQLKTENKGKAIAVTGAFCLIALIYALCFGVPNGSPWYMLPLGFLVMIPFVGIAEESGWRGYLQPALESKMRFPFSVLLVAGIWYVWHLDLWLDATSNHYGDSLIGFGITIFIWSFALAALYKATKSVFACAVYHAFMDAIGAVYEWNLLFDSFPGNLSTNIYRIVWLCLSVALWLWAEKNERKCAEKVKELQHLP